MKINFGLRYGEWMGRDIRALVIEGGGMRGIFPAGVLDSFMAADFNPFDLYIGVSAGVLNLGSYVSGQRGRNWRIFVQLGTEHDFVSWRKFLRGGHYLDLDWMWAQEPRDPFDIGRALKHIADKQFLITVTDVQTGRAEFVRPELDSWFVYAKASSAIPLLYRGFVEINGRLYCDGGVANPLPVQEAYRRGARQIVVLRTRPLDCSKRQAWGVKLAAYFFPKYPQLQQAIRQQYERYQAAVRWLADPPADCDVFQIAPPHHLRTTRTTQDAAILKTDYELGQHYGKIALSHLSETQRSL